MRAGLANMEHQSWVLAEAATIATLEQKFNRLVSLETTDKSISHLHNTIHPLALSSAKRSNHKRRFKETKTSSSPQYTKPCSGCWRTSNPRGSMSRKDWPAVRLVCHNCELTGHLKKVCRKLVTSREKATNRASKSEESVMFANKTPDSHHTYTDRKRDLTLSISVPHPEWNGEQFQRSSLEPYLSVTAEIAMMPGTHPTFSCISTNTVSHQSHRILGFVDTGALTCSSGPEIQRQLRCPDRYLVPTTDRIRSITNNRLHVNGVLFLHGRVGARETRQAVYVADNTSGLYLSYTALKDLDILPLDFPKGPCGCPRRNQIETKYHSISTNGNQLAPTGKMNKGTFQIKFIDYIPTPTVSSNGR